MSKKDREKLTKQPNDQEPLPEAVVNAVKDMQNYLKNCGITIDDICISDEYDDISYPKHYRGDGKTTCMDAINSMMTPEEVAILLTPNEAYWWGCAFKYVWRWPLKNGTKDIEKAIQCLQYILQLREE